MFCTSPIEKARRSEPLSLVKVAASAAKLDSIATEIAALSRLTKVTGLISADCRSMATCVLSYLEVGRRSCEININFQMT